MIPAASTVTPVPLSLSKNSLPELNEELVKHKRAKLWELQDKHHCPIVGTCLPMYDLKRFAKRFHFGAITCNDFELHVEAVGYIHTKNEVSVAIQRFLDHKYANDVKAISKCPDSTKLLIFWKHHLATGKVAGPLWACYTHKASTPEFQQTLYADIHMLSHQVGAGLAADTRRLEYLEIETKQQKATLAQQQTLFDQQFSVLRREKADLQTKLEQASVLEQRLKQTEQRLSTFESGQVVIDLGRKLLALQAAHDQALAVANRTWDMERTLKAAQEEMNRFAQERDDALARVHFLEQMLEKFSADSDVVNGMCSDITENCQGCSQSLSSRCVLFVGGRSSMIAQYRLLAERLGVALHHHDGGIEESMSRLPEMIHGADAVVCPTDNVSHAAYFQVKSQCKKVGKPCLFYTGTGISSFASAMDKIQRGEFSLAVQV